ncbi:1-acyl-sn-glycerol-3-phosphate acyltransferase epsilon [Caerostris extrusa]|uniref:1-acyl-sn-glycerol-3-phosphate acyltransferase epsilon n=1 Tax=Caerostris extrusa TaxID=172846 RepID=A0AAV4NHC3_CAEEX|nr:1-acyl-sn-glycerol-3-phosphate acyltransferase epsilon [Caerostris extrusa]
MASLFTKWLQKVIVLAKQFLKVVEKSCELCLKHVKMVVPTIVMFGVVPQYFLIWITWRFMSCLLPSWIYQAGDDIYYTVYQKFVLFFFEHITGTKLFLYGNLEFVSKKERVIYISNHQSTVDWVIVHMIADRQGSIGHVRYVMKDSLQLVPLYGFYFYETWMVIFPEGTRFNPEASEMIEKSQSFAKREVEFVTGCRDVVLSVHINRIDMRSVPVQDSDFKAWLHNLFHKKDRILDDYYSGKNSPSNHIALSKGCRSPAKLLSNFGCFLFLATLSAPFV